MIIGLPKEIKNNENRVGLTPAGVSVLTNKGHKVLVENSAGLGSGYTDNEYKTVGGFLTDKKDIFNNSDILAMKSMVLFIIL